jgi:hypothetical protein
MFEGPTDVSMDQPCPGTPRIAFSVGSNTGEVLREALIELVDASTAIDEEDASAAAGIAEV